MDPVQVNYNPFDPDETGIAAPAPAAPKGVPVDYDPFAPAQTTVPKGAQPVDFDPFKPGDLEARQEAFRAQHGADVPFPSSIDPTTFAGQTPRDVGIGEAAVRGTVDYGGRLLGLLDTVGSNINPMQGAFANAIEAEGRRRGLTPDQIQAIHDQFHPLAPLARSAQDYASLQPGEAEGLPAQVVQRGIPMLAELGNAAATGGAAEVPEVAAGLRAIPYLGKALSGIASNAPVAGVLTAEQAGELPDSMSPMDKAAAVGKTGLSNLLMGGLPMAAGASRLARIPTGAAIGYGLNAGMDYASGQPQDTAGNVVSAIVGGGFGALHPGSAPDEIAAQREAYSRQGTMPMPDATDITNAVTQAQAAPESSAVAPAPRAGGEPAPAPPGTGVSPADVIGMARAAVARLSAQPKLSDTDQFTLKFLKDNANDPSTLADALGVSLQPENGNGTSNSPIPGSVGPDQVHGAQSSDAGTGIGTDGNAGQPELAGGAADQEGPVAGGDVQGGGQDNAVQPGNGVKPSWQQQIEDHPDLSDEQRQVMLAKYTHAAATKPLYDHLLTSIASGLGLPDPILPPIKGVKRAVEKTNAEYSGDATRMKDLVRGTIIVNSPEQAAQALAAIKSKFDVTDIKDRMIAPDAKPTDAGYRDVNITAKVGGQPVEIQINTPQMMAAKDVAHKLYEKQRALDATARQRSLTKGEITERNSLLEGQKTIYGQAWDAVRNSANLAGETVSKEPGLSANQADLNASTESTPDVLSNGNPQLVSRGLPLPKNEASKNLPVVDLNKATGTSPSYSSSKEPSGGLSGTTTARLSELKAIALPSAESVPKTAEKSDWKQFPADSGTLGIPRAQMPQIKQPDREEFIRFLESRGIGNRQESVPADTLKPTQAEYSPGKVAHFAARGMDSGRAVLASSDGRIIDGHHQWMAYRDAGKDVPIVRLDAPASEILKAAHDFPKTQRSNESAAVPIKTGLLKVNGKSAGNLDKLPIGGARAAVRARVMAQITGKRTQTANGDRVTLDKIDAAILIGNADKPTLAVLRQLPDVLKAASRDGSGALVAHANINGEPHTVRIYTSANKLPRITRITVEGATHAGQPAEPKPAGAGTAAEAAGPDRGTGGEDASVVGAGDSDVAAAGAAKPVTQAQTTEAGSQVMQNRDRGRAASIQQMASIANAPDASRLSFSRDPNTGAPMVSAADAEHAIPESDMGRSDHVTMADGEKIPVRYAVVDAADVQASHNADGTPNAEYEGAKLKALNNGRIAGLKAAYAKGEPGEAYKLGLHDETDLTGISSKAIASKKNPVLIRLYDASHNKGDMGARSNAEQSLGQSATEKAYADARALPDLSALPITESGELSTNPASPFYREFLRNLGPNEAAKLVDSKGLPSKQFFDRVRAAVFAKAYGSDRMVSAMAEDADPDARNVLHALVKAAPAWSQVDPSKPLGDYARGIAAAFDVLRAARESGHTVDAYLKQGSLIARDTTGDRWAQFFADHARSPNKMAEGLKAAADLVEQQQAHDASTDMFGGGKLSAGDITDRAIRGIEERYGQQAQQTGLFTANGRAARTPGQAPDRGSGAGGEPAPEQRAAPERPVPGESGPADEPGPQLNALPPSEIIRQRDSVSALRRELYRDKRVGEALAKLEDRGALRLVYDANDRFAGRFDGKRVILNAAYLARGEGVSTALHEIVHREIRQAGGLRAFVGEGEFDRLQRRLDELKAAGGENADLVSRAEARAAESGETGDRLAEERLTYFTALAREAQDTLPARAANIYRQIRSAIRAAIYNSRFGKWLESKGKGIKLTPDDFVALAEKATHRQAAAESSEAMPGEPVLNSRRAGGASADMFGGAAEGAQHPQHPQRDTPQTGDMFGGATARDHVDAAIRAKEDALRGAGAAPTMRQGAGELFAGPRPEQARIGEPGEPLHPWTPVDTNASVPLAGGVSDDGHTVYIDKRMPAKVTVDGKPVDAHEAVGLHERTEWPLMHLTGPMSDDAIARMQDAADGKAPQSSIDKLRRGEPLSYAEAHAIATHTENKFVADKYGVDPQKYQSALGDSIKQARAEAPQEKAPANLDAKPYTDEGDERLLENKPLNSVPSEAALRTYPDEEDIPKIHNLGHAMALAGKIRALFPKPNATRELVRNDVRAALAQRDRAIGSADQSVAAFVKHFDKRGQGVISDPLKAMEPAIQFEKGQQITDAKARPFFAAMRQMLDRQAEQIQSFGNGYLEHLVTDYFPHLWEDPESAASFMDTQLSRRPLGGGKAFTKERVFDTLEDGIKAGMKPITHNPAEMVMMRYQSGEKLLTQLRIMKALEDRGLVKTIDNDSRVPKGWAHVNDRAFGNKLVPDFVAKDMNNYLDPGLTRFKAWRGFRWLENTLLTARLGLSAFHAGMTTIDTMATHADIGWRRMLLHGDIAGGLHELSKIPTAVYTSPKEGTKLLKQFYGQAEADPHTAAILNMLAEGGGRGYMSPMDFNDSFTKMIRAWRQDDKAGMAKQSLPGLMEATTRLISHKLVPAQKMTARVMHAKFKLDEVADALGKQKGDYAGIIDAMNPDAMREMSYEINKNIDDRLGQFAYDNLFWNKTARDALHASVQSVGWNFGTARLLLGGAKDAATALKNAATGDNERYIAPLDKAGKLTGFAKAKLTDRLSYLITLNAVVAMAGASLQYMMTGSAPNQTKDFFFPRTGRTNPDGSEERLSFPSYVKDEFALATHPFVTASHKLHPVFNMATELATDKDFYGTQIYDPDASLPNEAKDVLKYLGESFLPYSVKGSNQAANKAGSAVMRMLPFIGITPAPGDITKSPFNQYVTDRYYDQRGTRTQAQAERSRELSQAIEKVEADPNADIANLDAKGQRFAERAAHDPKGLTGYRFGRLPITQQARAYDMATPAEREQFGLSQIIHRNLGKKLGTMSPEDRQTVLERINDAEGQQ